MYTTKKILNMKPFILWLLKGMIKKSSASQFKTTRFNKPLINMKVKDNDKLINVVRLETIS